MSDQYTVRTQRGGYRVIKFDFLLNVECVYNVRSRNCDCHQYMRPTCKHRRMVDLFLRLERIDRGYFFCYDTDQWFLPLTEKYASKRRARIT